ncbi:STM4015 family protein [Catellatospora sichuanensis]|uniref:STM4015 family protein n=1 Tax=Catellatospora sichuanensis TaxID=1969805 RepID=UPI00118353DE|nr:STM4015 family protein [Catellatospora sichuanensis]
MTIGSHITTFAGRPVAEYPADLGKASRAGTAWRLEDPDYDDTGEFLVRLEALAAEDWADQVGALVIGNWGGAYDSAPPIGRIVAALPRFPRLRALFLGEITYEECEISWIQHTDITPLLEALPQLEVLTVRGATDLSLKPVRHMSLRELTIESGGLPADVVRAVGECDLPALTHLELWLGTDNYGGDADVADLAPILSGARLPALTSLALRDAEIADLVAVALAGAPVVARLQALDLSLGMLGDDGAAALLAGQPLTHLRKLDLHHHFIGPAVIERLTAELGAAGVELDVSGADARHRNDRYIAVSE